MLNISIAMTKIAGVELQQEIDMEDKRMLKKVMFIDANKRILKTVKSLFEKSACDFIGLSNSFDGLCKTVEYKPDVIFIDINSPQLNGFEFCVLLKNKDEFTNIPIVLLATRFDIFEQVQAEIVGAEKILIKPFNKSELLAAAQLEQADAA